MTVADDRQASLEADNDESPGVTAHTCSPERTVFTEEGNTEAWISTDTTVELHR